jgi:putative membrane protein
VLSLAFSAFYELIEWIVAIASGGLTEVAFLGTQGFVLDTQTDMAAVLIGAITALLTLAPMHDQQLRNMKHV